MKIWTYLNITLAPECSQTSLWLVCISIKKWLSGSYWKISLVIDWLLSLGLNFYFGLKFLNCLKIQNKEKSKVLRMIWRQIQSLASFYPLISNAPCASGPLRENTESHLVSLCVSLNGLYINRRCKVLWWWLLSSGLRCSCSLDVNGYNIILVWPK